MDSRVERQAPEVARCRIAKAIRRPRMRRFVNGQ
jgi:hypothetical protein